MRFTPRHLRRAAATGAVLAAASLGAAGVASAATTTSTSSSHPSSATAPPTGARPSGTRPTGGPPAGAAGNPATLTHGPGETLLTGTDLQKATAAASAAVPGATIVRAETNSSGGYPYEVHLKKSDGTYVTVELNSDFGVITTISGFGAGPAGGPAGRPAGGPSGRPAGVPSGAAPSGAAPASA